MLNNNLKNQGEQFRDYFNVDINGNLQTTSNLNVPILTCDTINATTENIINKNDYDITGYLRTTDEITAFYGTPNAVSMSGLQSQMITSNSNINVLQSQMITANSNIGVLQSQMITSNSNINVLQSQMITANSNINVLQNQVSSNTSLLVNKVNKTGDTMTGNFTFNDDEGYGAILVRPDGYQTNLNPGLLIGRKSAGPTGFIETYTINNNTLNSNKINNTGDVDIFDNSNNLKIAFRPNATTSQMLDVDGTIFCDRIQVRESITGNTPLSVISSGSTLFEVNSGGQITGTSLRLVNTDVTINGNDGSFSLLDGTLRNVRVNNITSGSLNISGNSNLSNVNINGNLNVFGGSFTSQSVINQFTSMSIIMNPAGNIPALGIQQTGGSGAIMEVLDNDSNIRFQINQDCELNLNNTFKVNSQGNITGNSSFLNSLNVANNLISNSTQNQLLNDTYIGSEGIEVLTQDAPMLPSLPTNYTGTVYSVHNEADLINAIASVNDFDIIELQQNITLTASRTINKNVKLTSHNTQRFISFNGVNQNTLIFTGSGAYLDNVQIQSLGTGTNEIGVNFMNSAGNFVVNNCLFFVDEFAISITNVNSFIINACSFAYARAPTNESLRFISLIQCQSNTHFITNNTFNGLTTSADSSIQCVSTANGVGYGSSTFVISGNTTNGTTVQRLFMLDGTSMTSSPCTWYLMNNTMKCSSGFFIWYSASALQSQVAFYLSGNTETLGGTSTGSKGLIGLDNVGAITSVNYNCKFFSKNNTVPSLRIDYGDLTSTNSRTVAYVLSKLTPTQLFDTIYYDNVNIDGILNVNSGATFNKNISVSGLTSLNMVSVNNLTSTSNLSVMGSTTLNSVSFTSAPSGPLFSINAINISGGSNFTLAGVSGISILNLNNGLQIGTTGGGSFNPTISNLTTGDSLYYNGTAWQNGYYVDQPTCSANYMTLSASAFSSPFNLTNQFTRYEVYNATGTSLLFDSGNLSAGSTYTFAGVNGTTYQGRTRHQATRANSISPWSSNITFTPSDIIAGQLTTSLSAYMSASVNSLVQVTQTEYNNVIANVTGSTQLFSNIGGYNGVTRNTIAYSVSGGIAIPNGRYYITALRMRSSGVTNSGQTFIGLAPTAQQIVANSTYYSVNTNEFSLSGGTLYYFVYKAPTITTGNVGVAGYPTVINNIQSPFDQNGNTLLSAWSQSTPNYYPPQPFTLTLSGTWNNNFYTDNCEFYGTQTKLW